MSFSTKYLAEAIVLLGIAWAVIRWIGRSLLDISGGSRDAEGHRFLESVWRPPTTKPADPSLFTRAAAMSEAERQAIYDDLVARLEAGDVSDSERAFALAVAMKRLGLRGGKAAAEVVKKL